MSRVYANSLDLNDFQEMLGRNMINLDRICDEIERAINTAENDWQDQKAVDFHQRYNSQGKPSIEGLKEVMSENRTILLGKIEILERYQKTGFSI